MVYFLKRLVLIFLKFCESFVELIKLGFADLFDSYEHVSYFTTCDIAFVVRGLRDNFKLLQVLMDVPFTLLELLACVTVENFGHFLSLSLRSVHQTY